MPAYYANAKINLTLDITGRRADGYHLLSMIMQSVSLRDTLTVEFSSTGITTLTCTDPTVPCDGRNLVLKACAAFFAAINLPDPGIAFHLTKVIPSEAGLAGGSADAAAALRALNELFQHPLNEQTLLEIGLKLGADLPFCLTGGTCLAEGIGEILTPLPAMPDCSLLIVKPAIGSSTVEAYRLADTKPYPHPAAQPVIDALSRGDLASIGRAMGNSFQEILQLPEVREICDTLLRADALGACMTGSGSAVCGIFAEESAARNCLDSLRSEYSRAYLCHPVSAGWQPI